MRWEDTELLVLDCWTEHTMHASNIPFVFVGNHVMSMQKNTYDMSDHVHAEECTLHEWSRLCRRIHMIWVIMSMQKNTHDMSDHIMCILTHGMMKSMCILHWHNHAMCILLHIIVMSAHVYAEEDTWHDHDHGYAEKYPWHECACLCRRLYMAWSCLCRRIYMTWLPANNFALALIGRNFSTASAIYLTT